MSFTNNLLPEGEYKARFLGTESTTGEYGECVLWNFQTTGRDDKFNNYRVNGISGIYPTTKNKAGKYLKALCGGELPDKKVETDHMVGREVNLKIIHNDKGYPSIEDIQAV